MRRLFPAFTRHLVAALVLALTIRGAAAATSVTEGLDNLVCPNAEILGAGLFTKVCWGCLFPISLAGITLGGSADDRPASANKQALCACGGDLSKGRLPTVGISLGFWQPVQVLELTRRPYCFPAMAGAQLSGSLQTMGGDATVGGTKGAQKLLNKDNASMFNFHLYSFPLLAILQLADLPGCMLGGNTDFDLAVLGEAFPNWYQDEIAFLVNPEAMLFANPIAQAAMPVDCVASTLRRDPIDKMFWTAGCWGGLYPFSGNVNDSVPVRAWSLLSTRALALMGRLGFLSDTTGTDAICSPEDMKVIKKSQYRMQMMFPVPESRGLVGNAGTAPTPPPPVTGSGIVAPVTPERTQTGSISPGQCCHPIGMSQLVWGDWRRRPGTGEDAVFLIWQWIDCCLGAI
jgi:conjugal transfer pilus assembly protein TraU